MKVFALNMNMQISAFDNLSAITGSFYLPFQGKKEWKKKKNYFSKYFHCKEIKLSEIRTEVAHGYSVTWFNLLKIGNTSTRKERDMKEPC